MDKSTDTMQVATILTVTGSDGTGGSGIQADIKTCDVLGGYALTVVTAVTVQNSDGILSTHTIPSTVVDAQMDSVMRDVSPKAVKIGMVCDADTVDVLACHLSDSKNVVLDTAFVSSRGEMIADDSVIDSVCRRLMPLSDVVLIKASEVETLLKRSVGNIEDVEYASRELVARYCMRSVIIQGVKNVDSMQDDVFAPSGVHYSVSPLHGMSSTLATSIAVNLAQGCKLTEAVDKAYGYLRTLAAHACVTPRQQEVFHTFMQLIVNNSHQQHDVQFYADHLNISPRYLVQISQIISSKTPKQIIDDALADDAVHLLSTTTNTMQQIALELGFSSQAQFTKFFRRTKGMSPTEFRRNC